MDLTDAQWQTVIGHTTAADHPSPGARNAPDVVMICLAVLVGDVDQIVASHTNYTWAGPTAWSTWAFTPSALAHVEATFEPEGYDALEDRQRRQPGSFDKPVEPTALTARTLPLRAATSFAVTRVYHRSWTDQIGSHRHFTPLEIEVAFGSTVERIGIQTWFGDQAKRERWERFVATAREAVISGGAE
ncbi:hypothetical protein MSAS_23910 [Mycobacterium saskatchewanense]|uniref:Uncharacterized protein n=1 Tax=Mycobacterium saskatchewanense TaxID=220927 RepID=A0AAJ3NQ60_9MYCO|nr:hypothetical protein [Mycobacterium saskatchewanense]ORW70369.1 hypothetical protein AWC23_17095 [Mycobacterium saskatchewanense]BBX63217.1 hypothetical protein MSAS_23910 [Mycobacterium saskatchewanense]